MIWCIEDDKNIRDIEIYTLKSTGFEAVGFSNGRDFFKALDTHIPELIKLKQNSKSSDIPVIMATAKGMEYDKIQSLDLGADDYLVKPFGMMEMVSRIKAVLRRCRTAKENSILKYGTLSVDLEQHVVTLEGERVMLTYKEFELLRLFLTNIGTVFTRDTLFSQIWGEEYIGESRTIDVHIRMLRHKIGKYGEKIETVRNVGYRMEAFEQ